MKQLAIRALDDDLEAALRQAAAEHHTSLNRATLMPLRRGVGLWPRSSVGPSTSLVGAAPRREERAIAAGRRSHVMLPHDARCRLKGSGEPVIEARPFDQTARPGSGRRSSGSLHWLLDCRGDSSVRGCHRPTWKDRSGLLAMKVLLDTNAYSQLMRGDPGVSALMQRSAAGPDVDGRDR